MRYLLTLVVFMVLGCSSSDSIVKKESSKEIPQLRELIEIEIEKHTDIYISDGFIDIYSPIIGRYQTYNREKFNVTKINKEITTDSLTEYALGMIFTLGIRSLYTTSCWHGGIYECEVEERDKKTTKITKGKIKKEYVSFRPGEIQIKLSTKDSDSIIIPLGQDYKARLSLLELGLQDEIDVEIVFYGNLKTIKKIGDLSFSYKPPSYLKYQNILHNENRFFTNILTDVGFIGEKQDDYSKKELLEHIGHESNHYAKSIIESIKKPIYPNIEKFPDIQEPQQFPSLTITKDQFETETEFKQRYEQLLNERKKTIRESQKEYRNIVEKRNQLVLKEKESISEIYSVLTNNYNKRINKIATLNDDLKKISLIRASKKLIPSAYITEISYNSEQGKLSAKLNIPGITFDQPIESIIDRKIAKEIFLMGDPAVGAEFKVINDTKISLIGGAIYYKNNIYKFKLTDKIIKKEQTSIQISSYEIKEDYNKINISEVLDKNAFQQPQNPNLIDKFATIALPSVDINNGEDDLFKDRLREVSNKKRSDIWFFNISIEDYAESDKVIFAKNSGESMNKVMKDKVGVPERQIYSLINDEATSGRIKDQLHLMLNNVKNNDTVIFYYSGHGIPVLPDRSPYILPQDKIPDFIGDDDFFKLNNIYTLLSESKASKVIVFVDSCFSGSTDGISNLKGVAASRLAPKKITIDSSKFYVMTAGNENQYSNMYKQKGHRLFSYYLMDSILNGDVELSKIYKNVNENVSKVSFQMGDLKRQNPVQVGNSNFSL